MTELMTELMREPFPLKGKTIMITGVNRRKGIGYAIVRQAAAWGADNLNQVLTGIKSELTEDAFLYDISGDFLKPDEPQKVMEEVNKNCGHIDALVCNHALSGSDRPLGELTADMLDKHWAVNTRSSLLLAQYFAEQHDATSRGQIIFMTSGQSLSPMPGEVAYTAAKGALAEITLTLSDQLADENITVNTVNPGPVDTGYLDEDTWETVKSKFPFRRFGQPEDPAKLIAWLLTDEASWITGQVINSEGGFGRWR